MKIVKTMLVLVCVTAIGIGVNVQAAENGTMPNGEMQSLLAVDSTERDWKIIYGLKVWANEWSLPVELRAYDKTYILEYESGYDPKECEESHLSGDCPLCGAK